MAQRRMFSLRVVDTDKFMDMPTSAQALYFHLGMHGDDDGFVSSPKKISRAAGCNDDDLRLLMAKGFIIPFDSGVVVISEWRVNNTLKNDRYQPTLYQAEKAKLRNDETGKYIVSPDAVPLRFQDGSTVEPQHNLTKPNQTEQNPTEGRTADKPPTPARKEFSKFGWVKLTQEEHDRLVADLGEAEVKRCIDYIDEAAQSTRNKNKWKDWNLMVRRCHRDGWGKNTPPQGGRGSQVPDYGGADNWSL